MVKKFQAIILILKSKEFLVIARKDVEAKEVDKYVFEGNLTKEHWNYCLIHLLKHIVKK